VRSIPVRGENGDELTVYEFLDRRFICKVRRHKLDTGELVQALDGDTFQLPTGEKLVRIDDG
jgi:hypothetical protein